MASRFFPSLQSATSFSPMSFVVIPVSFKVWGRVSTERWSKGEASVKFTGAVLIGPLSLTDPSRTTIRPSDDPQDPSGASPLRPLPGDGDRVDMAAGHPTLYDRLRHGRSAAECLDRELGPVCLDAWTCRLSGPDLLSGEIPAGLQREPLRHRGVDAAVLPGWSRPDDGLQPGLPSRPGVLRLWRVGAGARGVAVDDRRHHLRNALRLLPVSLRPSPASADRLERLAAADPGGTAGVLARPAAAYGRALRSGAVDERPDEHPLAALRHDCRGHRRARPGASGGAAPAPLLDPTRSGDGHRAPPARAGAAALQDRLEAVWHAPRDRRSAGGLGYVDGLVVVVGPQCDLGEVPRLVEDEAGTAAVSGHAATAADRRRTRALSSPRRRSAIDRHRRAAARAAVAIARPRCGDCDQPSGRLSRSDHRPLRAAAGQRAPVQHRQRRRAVPHRARARGGALFLRISALVAGRAPPSMGPGGVTASPPGLGRPGLGSPPG